MMIVRHLLAILLLPFVVVWIIPRWALLGWSGSDTQWIDGSPATTIAHTVGALVFVAGFALFAWCVALFARVGEGTLAPWDPTRRLVVVGPYRYVRNPMITGVLAMLVAESIYFGSRVLAIWAATFFVINTVYFVLLEEPGLESRFGESYAGYRSAVGRWLPTGRPWKNV
ncbi:MAG TPA: isoprenylcysteine carboxylmethyltransferase family protein [Gemmatimonadaceae bacterium]|jgi:protein-S-isoprenylcysteine O-methyltransferase Ste14|nr:isoprenylcysteine carboxylmethyltransferase family protein [Gemmatimonadaceae bacterium]